MYHQTYYKAVDVAKEEVRRWFDQPDICIIRDIENLLLKGSNEGGGAELFQVIIEFLSGDA